MINNSGPKLEKDFNEFIKTIPDAKSKTPPPAKTVKAQALDIDIISPVDQFWTLEQSDNIKYYKSGKIQGSYGNPNDITLETFYSKIADALRNLVIIQLDESEKTIEDVDSYLEIINRSFKVLFDKLSQLDVNNVSTSSAAFFHGFINSYIDHVIKKHKKEYK